MVRFHFPFYLFWVSRREGRYKYLDMKSTMEFLMGKGNLPQGLENEG